MKKLILSLILTIFIIAGCSNKRFVVDENQDINYVLEENEALTYSFLDTCAFNIINLDTNEIMDSYETDCLEFTHTSYYPSPLNMYSDNSYMSVIDNKIITNYEYQVNYLYSKTNSIYENMVDNSLYIDDLKVDDISSVEAGYQINNIVYYKLVEEDSIIHGYDIDGKKTIDYEIGSVIFNTILYNEKLYIKAYDGIYSLNADGSIDEYPEIFDLFRYEDTSIVASNVYQDKLYLITYDSMGYELHTLENGKLTSINTLDLQNNINIYAYRNYFYIIDQGIILYDLNTNEITKFSDVEEFQSLCGQIVLDSKDNTTLIKHP